MQGGKCTDHLKGYHRWCQFQIQMFVRSWVKGKRKNVEQAEFLRRMNYYRVAHTYHRQSDLGMLMQQLMWLENGGKCKQCPDYPYDIEMGCRSQELASSKRRRESLMACHCQ
jgi:hypothetical protein